jgi:predicted MFS family arabinose efflux permease
VDRPLSRGLTTVLALAVGLVVADLYYLQPLLHQIQGQYHLSAAGASLLITLVQAGYATGIVLLAPLGDVVARRPLISSLYLVAAALVGACALAPGFAVLAVLTYLVGVISASSQLVIPLAADLAPPEERGRVIARVMTGLLSGVLLSRTVSGLVAQAFGWRAVFVVAAAALALMSLTLARVLPHEGPRPHVPYSRLVTGSLHLLATEPRLRQRAGYGMLAFASINMVWTVLTFHLSARPFGYSKAEIGLFGLFGVAGMLAANVAGHHADRQRTHLTTVAAAVLILLSFVVLGLGQGSVVALGAGLIVLDAGMQGMQITNQSIVYSLDAAARSRMNSAYMLCAFVGAALGSAMGGQVYDHFGWTGDMWLGAALGTILVVAALVQWRRVAATRIRALRP